MNPISFVAEGLSIVPFEDEDVNPGVLGRGLANWVEEVLAETPYSITEVVAEDWSYRAIVRRRPYMLWVGCTGQTDFQYPEGGLSPEVVASIPALSVEWTVWVKTEGGMLGRLFRGDDRNTESAKLEALLMKRVNGLGGFRLTQV